MRLSPLFEWLVDGAPGATSSEAVVQRLGDDLVAGGVPVARIAAFVRTLHPHIMGRAFYWKRGRPVEVRESSYALLADERFKRSPIGAVYATGQEMRQRLGGDAPLDLPDFVQLRQEGYTDFLLSPLRFTDGQIHAITFASDAPDGFSDTHLDTLRDLVRPLARLAEILALRRTAVNLLSAYVGRDAGERVLRGNILRGDTETIACVVWFSDLRGFTTLSGRALPGDIISMLNQIFDCQVPAVERNGGQVLKFMGDGMLAIFPVAAAGAPAAVCAQAVAAARQAFGSLDDLNGARHQRGEEPLSFGVSLHIGDVAYGNIGGASRLDFTCIGPAVNVASRIEGLTGKLGKRVLVSQEFAQALGATTQPLGQFELKGVDGARAVHELVPSP